MQRFAFRAGLALVLGAAAVMSVAPAFGQDDLLKKVTAALPDKAPAQPKQPRKVLLYSKTAGFRHDSIPVAIKALTMIGDKTGAYTALATEDESIFEPEKLKAFDAVFMVNTTGNCLKPKNGSKDTEEALKKSLEDFVKGGKGLIGLHSATDTYREWKAYNMMMGGAFVNHPWTKDVPIKNLAPKNPLNAAFGGKDFDIDDEIYEFRGDTAQPTDRKFLLALDTSKMNVSKGSRKDGNYPVSWASTYGKGRTFYCSLGHRKEIYTSPAILKHYLAGLQYVMGDLQANVTPTPPDLPPAPKK